MDLLLQLRLYGKENSVTADSLRVIRLPRPSAVVTDLTIAPPAREAGVQHEVEPAIPASVRARIQAPTMVPVLVFVDSSGHVTQAWSKATGHGLERYLADAAVRAARKWTFVPARSQDGSPAAATKTIAFEFTPAGQ
jgi:TonB family protein